jgi:multimeric flavodoxin WrbA
MHFLIVLGSRNPAGQTARAAQGMRDGLTTAGAEGELIYLPTLKIKRCRQCNDNGWGTCRPEGQCVIEDDFISVVERIRAADVVVFATPVYFGDQSESMRAFTDRLRRTCRTEEHRLGIAGKPTVGVCVAGGGGGGAPSCTVSLEKVLRTCGFDVVDMVPARRQNLDHKVEILKTTGRWLATGPTS